MRRPKCGDCLFFVESEFLVELEKIAAEGASGNCHRFPPQVFASGQPDAWPEVSRRDFCGEFVSAEDAIAAVAAPLSDTESAGGARR